ncbi:CACNA1B [Symbiodinium microadriaticum]|nr:CACNA1B [Symbiodinium microadriaticum]
MKVFLEGAESEKTGTLALGCHMEVPRRRQLLLFLCFRFSPVTSLKSTDLLQRWLGPPLPKIEARLGLGHRSVAERADFDLQADPGRGSDVPFRDALRNHADSSLWKPHPDPVGISAGIVVFFYAVYSLYKYQREANRIISLFEANTQIKVANKSSKSQLSRRFLRVPSWLRKGLRVFLQEEDLVYQIDTLDKAFKARKAPLAENLRLLRHSLSIEEMAIWNLDHGEEEVLGPRSLAFVHGHVFATLCSLVIVANMVVMFVQFQAEEKQPWFALADNGFLVFYCLELILKALYYQSGLLFGRCSTVWWNWLDLAIVVSGLLEQAVLPLLGSGGHLNLTGLRALRLLRLARVARGLKLLRFLVESDLSWTQHPAFESFMMGMIVLNAIVMWLELDYPVAFWGILEHVLLVIYSFELTVRVGFHGCNYFVHEDWTWHYLDFAIVMLGVFEQWMIPSYQYLRGLILGPSHASTVSMPVVRSLRVARVFRVLRLARLLRSVKQLYKLINGVVQSLASVGWVILLTFLLLYSAALVFTSLVGQGYIYNDPDEMPEEAVQYFGTVWRSFLALFKLMNDDQSVVAPIITTITGQILFYAFMMLSNWMMLAILTSVVSDNMMSASRVKEEEDRKKTFEEDQQRAKRRIQQIFRELDEDQNGSISEHEMVTLLSDPNLQAELCEASRLHPADLVEMLYCSSYRTPSNERVILYHQFLTMLQDESGQAKERSIFKVMESMRAMEFRLEKRLNAALQYLNVPPEEVDGLPSLNQELERTRELEDSPARSLAKHLSRSRELSEKAARGEPLPSIVVIRGHIGADGGDVCTVSTGIHGLRERIGEIEQPKNAWIEIARQAKSDPQLRGVADAVVQRTGVDADDVPEVPEPGDPYARRSKNRGEGSLVVAEILVARICAKHQSVRREKTTKRVTIKRPRRNESYNCFHGRRVSDRLHIIDLDGNRADIELPPADAVGLAGVSDPPPLFLPVSDVWTEFTHYLRKDGVTGPSGRRQRLDDLPPMRLSDPYTLLSEFIFLDVQSAADLGGFPGNPHVLEEIGEAFRVGQTPAKFLWEPRGFYDSVRGGGYDDVPAYATGRFRKTEMISARELLDRAQAAGKENTRYTPHCEPTFTRGELEQRRDEENCFRYTELAIPRGIPVTILARPMIAEAGTGEGADCNIRLVSPQGDEGPPHADLKNLKDRFRFRILRGHQVENLLRHRELNPTAYYGLALVAIAFIGWAASGYPGLGA